MIIFNKLLNFAVGAYQLWFLSSPLIISVLSMSVAIPAYMLLAAMIYSVGYSLLITVLDNGLQKIAAELKNHESEFSARLHHIEEHSESIAFKHCESLEKEKLLACIDNVSKNQKAIHRIQFFINCLQNTLGNLSYMFGLVLSAPGIIAKTLSPDHAFGIAYYFTSIVSFFTWKKNNASNLTALNVSLDRLEVLQQALVDWHNIQKEEKVEVIRKSNSVGVENLSMTTPEGELLFDQASFALPAGKSIVIRGASGIGKTSVLRAFAKLSPYAKGKIVFPEGDSVSTHYIPQHAYFPLKSTLLEAICYPRKPSQGDKEKVIALMHDLGFEQEKINLLEEKRERWNEHLSGGQQQRIAIIGAIVNDPTILFIDEGTSGLDAKARQRYEEELRGKLPKTTIIATDHHAQPGKKFKPTYDYQIKIKPLSNQGGLRENRGKSTMKIKEFQ